MSGNNSPNNRFPLPENWNVDEFVCMVIPVPNDADYISIMRGLIETLTWQRSFNQHPTEPAAYQVSKTWQAAFNSQPIAFQECNMPQLRVNPDTCLLEVNCSTDPDNPDWKTIITQLTDPRTDIKYPPPYPDPPPPGQTNQCLSAANVAEWVWYAGGAFAVELDDGGLLMEFITLVMGIITGVFTLATDVVIDDTITLFSDIDPETILSDWGGLSKQEFIDLLVCHMNPDGSFDTDEYGDFLSELVAKSAANPAWMLVHYIVLLLGVGGVSIVARQGGLTEAECAPCDGWCHTYDFTEMVGTGSLNTCNLVSAGALGLHWVDLDECEGTNPQIFTNIWPEMAYITSIHIEGNRSNDCDTYEFRLYLEIDDDDHHVAELETGYSAPPSATLVADGAGNRIVGYLWPYFGSHCNDMYITKFQICGVGYEPPY